MKILGIDPGTATTGFGVIQKSGNQFTALDFGVISTHPGLPMAERLQILSTDLATLIEQHQPDLIGVELLFFAKNQTTAITVAQARGVVLLTAAQHGLPIREITPPQVKQSVTGYGNARKNQVQTMIQKIFQLSELPQPDDAADALAVAYAVS